MANNCLNKAQEALPVSVGPTSVDFSKQKPVLTSFRRAYGDNEKIRIIRNLVGMGFVFVLIFTAFMSTSNLQSSLNAKVQLHLNTLNLLIFNIHFV
jgi:hypothetical protein